MDDKIARRRMWGGCGCMPDRIAEMFTQGERAAMAVIAFEASSHGGSCWLKTADIGRHAGVSVSTVRGAVRLASASGVVDAQRDVGRDHATIVIGNSRWIAWLRKGRWHGPARFQR